MQMILNWYYELIIVYTSIIKSNDDIEWNAEQSTREMKPSQERSLTNTEHMLERTFTSELSLCTKSFVEKDTEDTSLHTKVRPKQRYEWHKETKIGDAKIERTPSRYEVDGNDEADAR